MASYTPNAEEAYEKLVNTLSLADKPTQTSIATTAKIQGAAIEWQRGFTPLKVKNGTTPWQGGLRIASGGGAPFGNIGFSGGGV